MFAGNVITKCVVFPVLLSRHPVHKPSRPRVEPPGVQLDRQEGGPIREGQPDHTVRQVPPLLLGRPQIKVIRVLGCDITWGGIGAKVSVLDRSKQ